MPPAMAAEPAATTARMSCVAVAVIARSPVAVMLASWTNALTWLGPSSSQTAVFE